mgnify:CR=1 FL=1
MKKRQIVITGADGQLGLTFRGNWSTSGLAKKYELVCGGFDHIDITSRASVESKLCPDNVSVIVNFAAYTGVEKAENEEERSYRVNQLGVKVLAAWAKEANCKLIHISTDFVFSGEKESPYLTTDNTNPLNVYGKSKLEGENEILKAELESSTIIRTSWLYSQFRTNFVKTMLRLMSERESLNVVNDQIGSPTSTDSIVELIFAMLKSGDYAGTYHWSDIGNISWYEFAVAIQRLGLEFGILTRSIQILPIGSEKYPTKALRPKYSVLDINLAKNKFSLVPQLWDTRLRHVIKRIAQNYP